MLCHCSSSKSLWDLVILDIISFLGLGFWVTLGCPNSPIKVLRFPYAIASFYYCIESGRSRAKTRFQLDVAGRPGSGRVI